MPEDTETLKVTAVVLGKNGLKDKKEITIACGKGQQRIKWLGHVAIARYCNISLCFIMNYQSDIFCECVIYSFSFLFLPAS